jgi:hypothetical protein
MRSSNGSCGPDKADRVFSAEWGQMKRTFLASALIALLVTACTSAAVPPTAATTPITGSPTDPPQGGRA